MNFYKRGNISQTISSLFNGQNNVFTYSYYFVQALSVSFMTLSTLHYQMFIFSISGRINDQHSKHRGYGTGCYFVWYFNNQDFALPLNLSESINLYSTRQGRPFKSAIANMVNIFKFDTDEHIWIPAPSSSELWSDLNMCSN